MTREQQLEGMLRDALAGLEPFARTALLPDMTGAKLNGERAEYVRHADCLAARSLVTRIRDTLAPGGNHD